MQSIIKKIILHFLAFVIIYYPALIPRLNQYIAPLIFCIILFITDFFTTPRNSTWKLFNKITIRNFSIGIIVSSLYYALIYVLNNLDISLEGTRIVQGISFVMYLFIVIYFLKRLNFTYCDKKAKISFLLRVANIQGIICIAMMFMPSLKALAETLFLTGAERFNSESYILKTRIYGISNSYTYGLPIYHGILSGVCYYYGITLNKKYLKYLPLIFIVSLLNGRTGVLIGIILIIIVSLFAIIKRTKDKAKALLSIIICSLFLVLSLTILKITLPNVYSFISVLFNEARSLLINNQLEGTTKYLISDRLFFPEGIGLLFGTGSRVFGNLTQGVVSSDIGFVNDIFMGGIIYIFILYGAYYMLIASSISKKQNLLKIILVIALLVANWKGELFKNSTIIIGLFFILLIEMLPNEKNENVQNNNEIKNVEKRARL